MAGKFATAIAKYNAKKNNSPGAHKEDSDKLAFLRPIIHKTFHKENHDRPAIPRCPIIQKGSDQEGHDRPAIARRSIMQKGPQQEGNDTSDVPRHLMREEAHLSDYLEILKRRKWVIISFFIIIVGTVTAVSFCLTPQYEATAQILLGGKPTLMNPLGDSPERLPERNLNNKSQVQLLTNRSLARKVIDQLGLERKYALEIDSHDPLPNANDVNAEDEAGPRLKTPVTKEAAQTLNSEVLDWYQGNLTVNEIIDSDLVNVSFRGPDRKLITRIVNTHAQTAIDSAMKRYRSQAKDALDWLRTQIESQKKELQSSERAIYEFKKNYNVLSLEDSQIINSQEIQELSSALTKAKSERIAKQAIYLQLKELTRNQKDVMSLPEISNYSVIENLRNQLVDLNSRKLEIGTKYGPKHPKMMELNSRIHQIKNEMITESNRLQNTIKNELDRAAAIEKSITRSLNKQKENAMSLGERAIEYELLRQQAENSKNIYNFLLKQSEELGVASVVSSSTMRIVEKAEVPANPVSPKIFLNILGALFFALFTGTCMAFFLEYLDNTVKIPNDVAIRLGLPFLGVIPFQKALQKKDNGFEIVGSSNSFDNKVMAESPLYHISNRLHSVIRASGEEFFGRVLIVMSVTMGEGKSTFVARIAANLAEACLNVLIVDCDFQRPSLDEIFKLPKNSNGLKQFSDNIMSHHLDNGTLGDYSVYDILFLIALKKKSGNLIIENEDQTFIASFLNGVLIHIQNQNNPENNRIGTMLSDGGFITKGQLEDALQRQKRTGQPLGYIMVNAGYIERDKLREPLRRQIEAYIQKIFSWKKGRFWFEPGIMPIYESEKIFFEEDYGSLINNLGRIGGSKFIEEELFHNITCLDKENLYLLSAGTSHKLIGSLNQVFMRKTFEKLKQHFDVVLIDTPPLDAASGIESIIPSADGIVLVIKAGHLSVKIINSAINQLPEDKIIGTVLNHAKINSKIYY